MHPLKARNRPYALKAGEGWTYRFGIDLTVKSSEIQKGSGVAVLEYRTRHGEEPSTHTHQTEEEIFFVVEGEISFRCGEETFDLQSGGFIFLPHGIPPSYTIPGSDPVRLLVITSPVRDEVSGGWKGFLA